MSAGHDDAVIQWLVRLGERYDGIRAIVLTSTRATSAAAPDTFSDYDPAVYVSDLAPLAGSDAWFSDFGPVLVVLRRDWWMPDGQTCDGDPDVFTRLVMYEDGTKIDFGLAPVEVLRRECQAPALPERFDVGYRVLVDKDGEAAALKPPTYRAHIPRPPTEAEYTALVNNFWWNSTYIAKHLWRDDLLPATTMLDGLKQCFLVKVLEWSVEIGRDWNWRPGPHGKGLKKVLDPETYAALAATYSGGGDDDLWEALFRTAALFRKVAMQVGAALGYAYLPDLDRRVTAYLQTVRELPRTADREELAGRLLGRRYEPSA